MSRTSDREDAHDDEEIEGSSVALAIASGFATFFIVGIGISQLAHQWLPAPLFMGLVIGAIAGGVATATVTAGLTGGVEDRQRRIAGGFGGYTVGFFVGFVLAGSVLNFSILPSIGFGVVIGFLAAGWGSRQGQTATLETES